MDEQQALTQKEWQRVYAQPPTWVADEETVRCALCNSDFGLFNRRHHCRACGNVFCNTCCSKQAKLPQYSLDLFQRVCESCNKLQVEITTYVGKIADLELRMKDVGAEFHNFESQYGKLLKTGEVFLKYRKIRSPLNLRVSISPDLRKLERRDQETGVIERDMPIGDLSEIIDGPTSEIFKSNKNRIEGIENKCFTITARDGKTWDLSASTIEIKKNWITALEGIIIFYGPRAPYSKIKAQLFSTRRDLDKAISAQRGSYNEKIESDRQSIDSRISDGSRTPTRSNERRQLFGSSTSLERKSPRRKVDTSDTKDALMEAREKLDERGDAVRQLSDRTERMELESQHFLSNAKKLSAAFK